MQLLGVPEAQWVERWPTDLAVVSSSSARGEIFSAVQRIPLHTAFHYQPLISMIWLKYSLKIAGIQLLSEQFYKSDIIAYNFLQIGNLRHVTMGTTMVIIL